MSPPRTTEGRAQLHAVIDEDLIAEIHRLWQDSGDPKRWRVVEEIVRMGIEAYKALPEDHRGGQQDLLRAG